jgi:flagellar hook assembly protein FlgD
MEKAPPPAMSLRRVFILASVVFTLTAPPAAAGDRLLARDETLARGAPAARPAPFRFNLVGLHWIGSGSVRFRTADAAGRWSAWLEAQPEAEDLPDPGRPEGRKGARWRFGNPYWTGPARYIEYRSSGEVRRLRAYFVWSDPAELPDLGGGITLARAAKPGIITRSQWGADESIVRAPPAYAARVRFAVVHHTAGTNSYGSAESAAIVRGIQRYHVLANGWNDIGYNFLVDKYGRIFEGRGGGVDRNVIGAHAGGFNTGSTGAAVLGTYASSRFSSAATGALTKLLAWRLDVAHVDPLDRLNVVSGGNERYSAGTTVRLRAISGHRDTGSTSCPGTAGYGQLGSIAQAVAARGLPKLYDDRASGGLGGLVRVTGRLSTALPWTITIADASGATVATGSGAGPSVDWTWNASSILFGTYTYRIAAGPDVRPATGPVPGPPVLAVTTLAASPAALTPNGDGVKETTRISYALNTSGSATVDVLDDSNRVVRTLANGASYTSGVSVLIWDARTGAGAPLADGNYTLRVRASSPGQMATRTRNLVVDRTLGFLSALPTPFSPNGDGRADGTQLEFQLTRAADVRVRITAGSRELRMLFAGSLTSGAHVFPWNGRAGGGVLADGSYLARVEATTSLGTRGLRQTVRVDRTPPRVRVVRARRTESGTLLRIWLSENASVRVWYGRPRWRNGGSVRVERKAGFSRVRLPMRAAQVRLLPTDEARNRGSAVIVAVSG